MASADESDDGWDEFLDQFANKDTKMLLAKTIGKRPSSTMKTRLQRAKKAISLKNEGNAHFQEKKYDKAVVAYTAGLKTNCEDQDINTILLTNRAASQYYQVICPILPYMELCCTFEMLMDDYGEFYDWLCQEFHMIFMSQVKPDHLKALIRVLPWSFVALQRPSGGATGGLKMHPTDGKLQGVEVRSGQTQGSAASSSSSQRGPQGVALIAKGPGAGGGGPALDLLSPGGHWGPSVPGTSRAPCTGPVLFLYPEHQPSDFIVAALLRLILLKNLVLCFLFCCSFIDHLAVMFGEELPPWDTDRKYLPQNLQLFFEDEEKEVLYQVEPDMSLLKVLQHKRYCLSLFLFILDLIHCQSRMNIMFCKSWLSQLYCFGPRITILQTFFNSEDAKRNVKGHVPFRQPLISSNPHLDTRVCRHLKQIQKNKGQSGSLHPDSVYCNTVNHMNY
ncbi:Tetratricopeptide repeat protein 4 [Merluccius polli]|uniref:Tetratricopeptide repeat protein 4 n=1 Tax=Merluccius polli TaxID=89951 RepID=A0AA47NR08_MERPO|nr:Tetratricopeptide repeat protein 4 [Merluccius polli]